ncbi:MAG: Uncharacterised protein [Candidatus Nitrosopelagicus brevis]|nr:MAG: Uncharacterised protein [Candidatus Nitrosopelagicus brevis]
MFNSYFFAQSSAESINLEHPFLEIFLIAIAVSSLSCVSTPVYKPSVASLKHTKSTSLFGVNLLKVLTGLIFANNSNFCLNVTATLLGAPGFGIVVVGPLKHASTSSSVVIVDSGMYDASLLPFFSHCSEPASQNTISDCKLHSFSMPVIASTISGPIPSPFIIATFFVI